MGMRGLTVDIVVVVWKVGLRGVTVDIVVVREVGVYGGR